MKDIIFRHDDESLFLKLWNRFLEENHCSPRYLVDMLSYWKAYSRYLIKDRSFVMVRENKPIACCFLPIEKIGDNVEISLGDDYGFAPVYVNKSHENDVYNVIDAICAEEKVARIRFFLDPLNMEYQDKYNILRRHGYIDATSDNMIIDLENKKIWSDIRKGHKYDINRIFNNANFDREIIDSLNPSKKTFDAYVSLHHKCSGGATRSQATFELQYKLMCDGSAFLSVIKDGAAIIGVSYFLHFKGSVLYFSGADDPEYTDSKRVPLYHAMVWNAILYCQDKKYKYLEFSRPCGYGVQYDDYWDHKQLNIAHFKRGFRGKLVPFFRGLKYLNKNLFLSDVEIFKNKVMADG